MAPAIIMWDGGPTGLGTDWGTAVNWVGDQLPGSGDDAQIGAAFAGITITSAGTVTINSVTSQASLSISAGAYSIAAASTINNALTLSGGTFTGAGTLDVSGLTTWTGGTMSGTGITNANGVLDISGSANKFISQRTLNNVATATWTGTGSIGGGTGSTINNLAGALFQVQTDADLVNTFGGTATFANNGTFRKSVTAGTTDVANPWVFNNTATGTVDVQTGTLNLNFGGTSSSSFTVAALATLQFSAGTYTLDATSTVSGAGAVTLTGATVDFNGSYTLSGTTTLSGGIANFNVATTLATLLFSGGELRGAATVTVSGLTTWTGGTMSGTGITNANGGLDISGATSKFISQRTHGYLDGDGKHRRRHRQHHQQPGRRPLPGPDRRRPRQSVRRGPDLRQQWHLPQVGRNGPNRNLLHVCYHRDRGCAVWKRGYRRHQCHDNCRPPRDPRQR